MIPTNKKTLRPFTLALSLLLFGITAHARDDGVERIEARHIVILQDPPAALYEGEELSVFDGDRLARMAPTAPPATGDEKLNMRSQAVQAYLAFLDERHAEFGAEAAAILGREVSVSKRFRNALNGLVIRVTPAEAAKTNRLLDAVYLSARENHEVALDEVS
jgi:hypothetical protein